MPTFSARSLPVSLCFIITLCLAAAAVPAAGQSATLSAPSEVGAGAKISVSWTGPNNKGDFISLDPPDSPDRKYGKYKYTSDGSPVVLQAPGEPGSWVIRYHSGESGYAVLAERPLTVVAVTATLQAPASVAVGEPLSVSWTGPDNEGDFISIDPVDAPSRVYGKYVYTRKGSPMQLTAPGEPGSYLIRYHLTVSPYTVIGQQPLEVKAASATLEAPDSIGVGETFSVTWTGPDNARDFISIDPADAPSRIYGDYTYTKEGSPLELTAPGEPGSYLIRYHLGVSKYPVVTTRAIEVRAATATLDFPSPVSAGSTLSIAWTGPENPRDFISIDEFGAEERIYGPYTYVKEGSPLEITVPDEPGTYEVRYHLGVGYSPVIATKPLMVTSVSATVAAAGPIVADEPFEVEWTGPNNPRDFITIVPVGTPEREYGRYAYTRRGSPLRLLAPEEAGAYEVRYLTGQRSLTLASAPVEVAPSAAKGTLKVFLSQASASSESAGAVGAVEVILDASGSMLQRLDGKRRIELAREALLELTGEALPDGVPFALRVFGHKEADSCRTDLEIPLAPLDRGRTASTLRSVNAKNLAKTPIADSLRQVKSDLAGASGSRLVILVTDGEETCGGDPASVIEDLKASGFDVRVNIVGFAIDELMVKEEFERWARLGGGRYFDAADGESLRGAVRGALATTYEVLENGQVVGGGSLGGDAIELAPGDYTVRIGGRDVGVATVTAKEETRLLVEE